jgi:hypothetical protein
VLYFEDGGVISPTNIIKDQKFTKKFYRSLKANEGQDCKAYPYVGEFWGEQNYLRSAIAPVVFKYLDSN